LIGAIRREFSSSGYILSSFKVRPFNLLAVSIGWLRGGIIIFSFLAREKNKTHVWWALFLIAFIRFYTTSLFKFYLLFELSLIPILLIIITMGSQPERLSAGTYLIFYTTRISIPYVVILVLLRQADTAGFLDPRSVSNPLMRLLIAAPFLIKMPIFGLHFWLPKAHVEANTSGSMVLAGLLLKLGSFGVVRSSSVLLLRSLSIKYLFRWLFFSLVSSVVTLFQSDLKKLIAYSRVTHITFIIVSLSLRRKVALFRVILLSLAHGWAARGIFFIAGILRQATTSRMTYVLSSEFGLFWFRILFGILLVSNASIPPIPSFFPELIILTNIVSSNTNLTLFFLFLRLFVCYYNAFVFFISSHSKSLRVSGSSSKLLRGILLRSFLALRGVSLLWGASI